LKHVAEKYMACYITNGQFIAAAIAAGFQHDAPRGPNCRFNMPEKSLKALAREAESGKPTL
jgi:hypothetical protein